MPVKVKGRLKTTLLEGRKLITDDYYSGEYDRVFPIFEDESAYFARHIKVNKGDIVLDIGTGSGILGIFAAEKAKRIYATDVNPRAIEFAKRNAGMNGMAGKMVFLKGDCFGPVKGLKFDLILADPPFNITPQGLRGARFSDGGVDGMRLLKRILKGAPGQLKKNGRIQIITKVHGTKGRPAVIDEILKNFKLPGVEYTHLYPPTRTADFLLSVFGEKHRKFIERFCRGREEYYYVFVTVYNNPKKPFIREKKLDVKFRKNMVTGGWAERAVRRRRILGLEKA